jgi:hypothetical protein
LRKELSRREEEIGALGHNGHREDEDEDDDKDKVKEDKDKDDEDKEDEDTDEDEDIDEGSWQAVGGTDCGFDKFGRRRLRFTFDYELRQKMKQRKPRKKVSGLQV